MTLVHTAQVNKSSQMFDVGSPTSVERAICTRCVMDTTVPEIRFDEEGQCQYCHMHDIMDELYPSDPIRAQQKLSKLVDEIKQAGKGKAYDCICGVSGGRDSTWGLYNITQVGLRPLAVHFDNGWNSEIAVSNIQSATNRLHVDLETIVADWEEFRDLQKSFLKASVPDVEIPTDVAIHSILHRVAANEGVRYVFFCHSFRTEGIVPRGWSFLDGLYIEDVQRRFGRRKLRDYKNFKLNSLFYFTFIKKIRSIPIVNFFPSPQKDIDALLSSKLGWTYYGGHHHESTYTYFVQSYLLPIKFNIDKRKTEFSALIRSRQLSRETALEELARKPYEYDEKLIPYVLSKLAISKSEWEEILKTPPRTYHEFVTYEPLFRIFQLPIKMVTGLGWLPELLYLKYLG